MLVADIKMKKVENRQRDSLMLTLVMSEYGDNISIYDLRRMINDMVRHYREVKNENIEIRN